MQGISTVTQKGQVVIPQSIRKHFGLRTASKLYFEVVDDKIVARSIPNTASMLGFIKTKRKKPLSKSEMKRVIREAVVAKFEKKRNA